MTIRPPKQFTPYADSDLGCQMALEDTFRHLLDRAEASGWSRTLTGQIQSTGMTRH